MRARWSVLLLPLLGACGGGSDRQPVAEAARSTTTVDDAGDRYASGYRPQPSTTSTNEGDPEAESAAAATTTTAARSAAPSTTARPATTTTAPPASTTTAAPTTTTTAPPPPPPAEVTLAVTTRDFAFEPASLRAPGGAQATFTASNADQAPHTFTIAALGVDIALPSEGSSGSQTVTLPASGTFTYVCRIHGSMTGTLTVG